MTEAGLLQKVTNYVADSQISGEPDEPKLVQTTHIRELRRHTIPPVP